MTHHCHSEPKVYNRAHSWVCTFCGFAQMCNDMFPPLQFQAEWIYCLKLLCALPVHLSFPTNLWQPLYLLTVSIIMSFPECHIVGIIQYVAYSDWFLSFSNMHLRFLCVFSRFDRAFLFFIESNICCTVFYKL